MPDTALISKLPLADSFAAVYLEQWGILPLELQGNRLVVAVAGVTDAEVMDDLQTSFGADLDLVPVSRGDLLDGIHRAFAAAESTVELVRDLDAEMESGAGSDDAPIADARDLATQPLVIKFVNLLIKEAYEARASDIHLESSREGLRARFRIDGVLAEVASPP